MSSPIYKVGDTVTVISLDEVRRRGTPSDGGGYRINGITFNRRMKEHCGKNLKIIGEGRNMGSLGYILDIPTNGGWLFSKDMIRLTEADPVGGCFVDHCEFNKELL